MQPPGASRELEAAARRAPEVRAGTPPRLSARLGNPGDHSGLGASHAGIARQGLCNGAAAGDPAGSGGGRNRGSSFHPTSRLLPRSAAEPGDSSLRPQGALPREGLRRLHPERPGSPPSRPHSGSPVRDPGLQAQCRRGDARAKGSWAHLRPIISFSAKSGDRHGMGRRKRPEIEFCFR